jgi:transcriptional regulator with GAF, ATPase, and Fis domain
MGNDNFEALQRQIRALEEQIEDFGKLDNLLRLFSSSMPVEEILQRFMKETIHLCKAQEGSIILFAPADSKEAKTLLHHPAEKGKLDQAFLHLLTEWLTHHQRLLLTQDLMATFGLKGAGKKYQEIASLLSVPIEWQGRMVGALNLLSLRAEQRFGDRELRLLSVVEEPCAQFIAFAKLHEKLFTEPLHLHDKIKGPSVCPGLNSKSAKMHEVFTLLESVIPTDGRVLLEGESGTGKELIARLIHSGGPRKDALFVAVDCGALPANLLESELFGYVKGAFTGADRDKRGLFEEANGGTLFLDEIANMAVEMQSKLLRAIQEGEIRPLGSAQTQKVDVRIIAAASSDLRALVEIGKFRKDLFYRLNVVSVHLPSLRERKEDILLIGGPFSRQTGGEIRQAAQRF